MRSAHIASTEKFSTLGESRACRVSGECMKNAPVCRKIAVSDLKRLVRESASEFDAAKHTRSNAFALAFEQAVQVAANRMFDSEWDDLLDEIAEGAAHGMPQSYPESEREEIVEACVKRGFAAVRNSLADLARQAFNRVSDDERLRAATRS